MIIIHCNGIKNKSQLHKLLAKELSFPDYYGHNLDALMDCLTEIGTEKTITLQGWSKLGDWKTDFEEVFSDATQEFPGLQFIFD